MTSYQNHLIFIYIKPIILAQNGDRGMTIAGPCVSMMENLVFGSPCRLNLRPFCTPETLVKDMLDVWQALPLIFRQYDLVTRDRQRRCGTWAGQSRMSSHPSGPCGLAIGESLGRGAGAIPGVDRSALRLK